MQVQVDSLCASSKSPCANTESLVCPAFCLRKGQLGSMGEICLHIHINHLPRTPAAQAVEQSEKWLVQKQEDGKDNFPPACHAALEV